MDGPIVGNATEIVELLQESIIMTKNDIPFYFFHPDWEEKEAVFDEYLEL
jgi:hypothetical protein